MKKLIPAILFLLLFMSAGYAQNSVTGKLNFPELFIISPIATNNHPDIIPVKKIELLSAPVNNLNAILTGLPIIKLKETVAGKPVLFFTRFSLNDMLENSINSMNDRLLNTYDDHIQELFKEAPSLVTLKCTISL